MTDELDRLFGRLVQALAETGPGRLAVPFASAELYERLVPYRSNRAKLNVATHQDYEMTVLRLLAGERGYARLEPTDVQEALQREAAATNPDTALFRNFPDAQIMINRIAAERFLKGERAYAPPATGSGPAPAPAPARARAPRPSALDESGDTEADPAASSHFAVDEAETRAAPCAHCGGT